LENQSNLAKQPYLLNILHTVCFRDLAKLNLPMVVQFYGEPIFDTAPAASKNKARFKSGQS
jgi:hypothetical protein